AVGVFLFFQLEKVNGPGEEIVAETEISKNENATSNNLEAEVDESGSTAASNPEAEDGEDSANVDSLVEQIVYYYSLTCGHCKNVNDFLEQNNIASKVNFLKKEVSQNIENGRELAEAAQKCGMNPGTIGVPFLFAKGKCYMGGPDVEGFFKKEAGL
ncbi:MAG: glutaredoxin domain-containing protein, partial [Parcubacteria group bacterium]